MDVSIGVLKIFMKKTKELQSESVHVLLTESLKAKLIEASEEAGLDMSSYIRMILTRAVQKPKGN